MRYHRKGLARASVSETCMVEAQGRRRMAKTMPTKAPMPRTTRAQSAWGGAAAEGFSITGASIVVVVVVEEEGRGEGGSVGWVAVVVVVGLVRCGMLVVVFVFLERVVGGESQN